MANQTFTISGNIVDLLKKRIFPGTLHITNGVIADITVSHESYSTYILPGLIDAHIHIESSMLIPSEFARIAVTHGTVGVLADPHEIANVLGIPGIKFMIENAKLAPLKTYFGVPSCVPATPYETAGAVIGPEQIEWLFQNCNLKFMGEMMDYPGIIAGKPEDLIKTDLARKYGKPIDGHAPGLSGTDLTRYIQAGISTDHEAFELSEALAKIKAGMKILIREGSAAKNFATLHQLIDTHPDHVMFCSDDKHPDALREGHLNRIVRRALLLGHDLFNVLQCASLNPVRHYRLDVGLLQTGDPADFIVIDNFKDFHILSTYINGLKVAESGHSLIPYLPARPVNQFNTHPKNAEDFEVRSAASSIHVIETVTDQLITKHRVMPAKKIGDRIVSDVERDILKIAVINRYQDAPPAIGFIKNFGLTDGAIAASVAHDSHNIIAIGVTDEAIATAVNLIIHHQGGVALSSKMYREIIPLPVGGLMSLDEGAHVAAQYSRIAGLAKSLGSPHLDPFMTMSFMSLLVIPELKISDRGLFDSTRGQFISVVE